MNRYEISLLIFALHLVVHNKTTLFVFLPLLAHFYLDMVIPNKSFAWLTLLYKLCFLIDSTSCPSVSL